MNNYGNYYILYVSLKVIGILNMLSKAHSWITPNSFFVIKARAGIVLQSIPL